MKSIAKSFGKLNQMVSEKFAGATKHELSDEFQQLELQTEGRKQATDDLLDACQSYLKTVDKKRGEGGMQLPTGSEKPKQLPIEALSAAMISYGSDLPEDSHYGQVLLKVGAVERQLGEVQSEYAQQVRESLIMQLEEYMAEMK